MPKASGNLMIIVTPPIFLEATFLKRSLSEQKQKSCFFFKFVRVEELGEQ